MTSNPGLPLASKWMDELLRGLFPRRFPSPRSNPLNIPVFQQALWAWISPIPAVFEGLKRPSSD